MGLTVFRDGENTVQIVRIPVERYIKTVTDDFKVLRGLGLENKEMHTIEGEIKKKIVE